MTMDMTRRNAIRLLAAQLPFALAACSKPEQEILPYVVQPESVVPGVPQAFATVLPLSGRGRGVVVTSIDGRPTKIDGNPHHPASLGATDVFTEADILTLYDPDRSQAPLSSGRIVSWMAIEGELRGELERLTQTGGAGLALLTGRLDSPTFERQLQSLLQKFPKARWFAYDPLDDLHAAAGARMAQIGDALPLPDLGNADLIVSFDADFLGPGPDQIALARTYAERRLTKDDTPFRLIALEASPRQTGAKADKRYACSPADMLEILIALANGEGAGLRAATLKPKLQAVADGLRSAIAERKGRALLLVGHSVAPEGHALAHWLHRQTGAPIKWVSPRPSANARKPETLQDFASALQGGAVNWVAAVGCNPAYDAPGDLDLSKQLGQAIPLFHAGLYADETAALARWHIPLSHPLECWSDLRSTDGTTAICQPLIRPLHGSRSVHEVLAMLSGASDSNGYDLVRETWRDHAAGGIDAWWNDSLSRGTIENSGFAYVSAPDIKLPDVSPPNSPDGVTLVLRPDPCLYDGTYANNAWLQELPKPLTKEVWGHALQIGAKDAARLSLSTGDVVSIEVKDRKVECPVLISPGMPERVVALFLGLGRTSSGAIGNGIGVNAFPLRSLTQWWNFPGASLTKRERSEEVLLAQQVVSQKQLDEDNLQKRFPALGELSSKGASDKSSLYPERPRPAAEHAWAMVIDTARCIGCNTCMVACQSENNIPVVGPDQIEQGRQMHWLRVDVYDRGETDDPLYGFQPVPCMHCEKAPCEPVCPVAASIHDGEGLNVQVYNRCIGTRFCEANCPYKVRRFNFRAYADGQEYANLGADSYRAQKNPDVTVRTRGVMEKCTYCIQRLSAARRASERDDVPIPRDSVKTACQAACPTSAITFGDLTDPESKVAQLKSDERHYALLEELDTRPRTTYLAEVRDLRRAKSGEAG